MEVTPRVLALDLETTGLGGTKGSFDDLSTWQITAIAVAFRPKVTANVQTEVFVRRDDSCHAERRLLAQLVNYARRKAPLDCLIGYNSEEFDMKVLANRADALVKSDRPERQTLAFSLFDALDVPHRDLMQEIIAMQPDETKWPTLEESLTERDIPFAIATLDGTPLEGAAVADLGRRIVRGDATPRERRMFERYARSDVKPLMTLFDKLEEERAAHTRENPAAAGDADTATDGGSP